MIQNSHKKNKIKHPYRQFVIALFLTVLSGTSCYTVLGQSWQPVNRNARLNNRSRVSSGYKTTNRPTNRTQSSYKVNNSVNQNSYTNNSYNTNSNINISQPNTSRASISYSTTPTAENSFYPTIRESSSAYGNQQPGWVNMNNQYTASVSSSGKDSENQLSPEVLETIRQLREEYPEPRYQMAPPTPVTGNVSNGLMVPSQPKDISKSAQSPIDIQSSVLTFPAGKNIKIKSLDFRQTDVADALRSLARLININLMLGQGVGGQQVTVLFNDVTMEEAFNTLLVNYNLSFSWEGKILRIFPTDSAPTFTRIYPIQHTNAVDIQPMVTRLLSNGKGTVEIDNRTNSLIITDTLAKLTEIENMLPQIDVKETGIEITSRPVTEVFHLNYADATSLREPIEMLSSGVQIKEFSSNAASQAGAAGGEAAGRMDMMIITDTQNNLDRIRELLDQLDVPPKQVTIDAHIYEIDKNKEEQMGIDWQKTIPINGIAQAVTNADSGTTNLFSANLLSSAGSGVLRFGSLDVNQFSMVLNTLNTNSFAKVLSNPVITTLNNRPANINVGQQISYVSGANENAQTGNITQSIGQVDASIVLDVTPSVTGNDEVFLDIRPNITSVLSYTTLNGNSTPNLSTRSAQTQVICKNNHTIVIGGMIKTDKNESINKVPFLGNLPGIGKLFQHKTVKETRTELIIFITPHIVEDKVTKHFSHKLTGTPQMAME